MLKISHCPSRRPAVQEGFLLLEGLIALLIFSIALLGLVGLHARSIQYVTDGNDRALAAENAQKILGMMWADPNNLSSFDKHSVTVPTGVVDLTSGTGYSGLAALPDGKRTVTVAGRTVTIIIGWHHPGLPDASQYTLSGIVNLPTT